MKNNKYFISTKKLIVALLAAFLVMCVTVGCALTGSKEPKNKWAVPTWSQTLAADNVESMSVSVLRDGGQAITIPVPQETQEDLIAIINSIPEKDFKFSLDNLARELTVEDWLKQAEFSESIPEGGTIRLSICRSDNEHHGVLTYQEGKVYLSVLVEHWETNGVAYVSSVRWQIDNTALVEFWGDFLVTALDPDWAPEAEDNDDLNVENLELLYEDALIALYAAGDKLSDVVLQYGGYVQKLDEFSYNYFRPGCATWETDADGDGIKELYIIHQRGSGTGAAIDLLTVCEPNGDKLDVWYHDITDIQTEFNENRIAIYDAEEQSVTITYDGQTYTIDISDDNWYVTTMPLVTELAYINGHQVHYEPVSGGDVLLSFALSISGDGVPPLHYLPSEAEVSCLLRFTGDGFQVTDKLGFQRELPDSNPARLSAVGELFLSALNDEVEIVYPQVSMTDVLSKLITADAPAMEVRITHIRVVDLDGDGMEEVLLTLDTGTLNYGTMILHYNEFDDKIYSHTLWARVFNYFKTDGTFYFSNSSEDGGVYRISFKLPGHIIIENLLCQEYAYADGTTHYFIHGQETTEEAYNQAWEEHKAKPDVLSAVYTLENAEALLREHFAAQVASLMLADLPQKLVTEVGYPSDPSEYYLVASLPEQDIYLYARQHGEEGLLVWGSNYWELHHRFHTGQMNLPELAILDETHLAVISMVETGTGFGVEELVVYELTEGNHDQWLKEYTYDWQEVAESFNQGNELIYNRDINELTLTYRGETYTSGTLRYELESYLGISGRFKGAAIANGHIVSYQVNQNGTITVTLPTTIASGTEGEFTDEGVWDSSAKQYFPMATGINGFDLTWDIRFTGSGFEMLEDSMYFPNANGPSNFSPTTEANNQ